MRIRKTALTVIPAAVGGLAVVHLVGIVRLGSRGLPDAAYLASQVAFGLFAVATAAIGLIILWASPPARPTTLVGLSLSVMGVPLLADGVAQVLDPMPGADQLLVVYLAASSLAFYAALAAALRISQTFPLVLTREALGSGRRLRILTGLYGASLAPGLVWGLATLAAVATTVGLIDLGPRFAGIVTLLISGLVLLNFRLAYQLADPEGRRRVVWLSQGILVTAVTGAITAGLLLVARLNDSPFVGQLAFPWLALAGLYAGVVCVGVAVLYRGALDPALVVRRTTVYGGLGVLAVFVFAGVENLSTDYLVTRLRLPPAVGTWFAGGIVALAIGFIHSRFRGRVSKALASREMPADSQEGGA